MLEEEVDDQMIQIDQDHLDVIRELNGISIKDEAATIDDDINEKFERSIKGDEVDKHTERRQKKSKKQRKGAKMGQQTQLI